MTQNYVSLRSELNALHKAGEQQEDVMRDPVKWVRTAYSGLLLMHAACYHNSLKAIELDAQRRGGYIGGYRLCVDENKYLLPVSDPTWHEE